MHQEAVAVSRSQGSSLFDDQLRSLAASAVDSFDVRVLLTGEASEPGAVQRSADAFDVTLPAGAAPAGRAPVEPIHSQASDVATAAATPGLAAAIAPGLFTPSASPAASPESSFRLISQELDSLGMVHRRTQQLLNGLPLIGAMAIEHRRGDGLVSVSGEWITPPSAPLASRPALHEGRALSAALAAIGATTYKWQLPEEEAFLKAETGDANATFFPKGTLVYYAGDRNLGHQPVRLAYQFDIYAQEPIGRQLIYVDALNGRILGSNALLHEGNVAATAMTGYSGQQAITTDSVAGTVTSYRLRETSGGGKTIQTYNLKNKSSYGAASDFTDADNQWGFGDAYTAASSKDAFALDAHFGAEKTYDFFKEKFNRNSIDGNGFALKSYVHYGRNYFNAFWDGSRMTYGDGSSANGNLPLTSLDVCGHEIAHGLTSFTANLNYSYESGALNEGFSDIFGTAIEAYARGRTGIGVNSGRWNWTLGEDFSYVIRDMANPKRFQDPDTYQGTGWATGSGDNGGVHTNSGVLNYWFVLLTEGSGAGVEHSSIDIDGSVDTNDKGYAFEVRGLGLDKSQAVAYRTLTTYLSPTSNYLQARTWSLQAAADLVAGGQLTAEDAGEVAYAWNAVAVGGGTSASAERLFAGSSANNTLYGGHLADVITGMGGSDELWGCGGPDTFVLVDGATQYYAGAGGADRATIRDFNSSADKLRLSATQDYTTIINGGSTDLYRGSSSGGELLATLSGVDLGSLSFNAATPGSTLPAWAIFV